MSPGRILGGALLVAAASMTSGCAQTVLSPPHSIASSLSDVDPERLEARFERNVRPALNLEIAATLWDPALFVSDAASGADGVVEPREETLARHERWHDQYLAEHTAFTVVLEMANRPAGDDARGDPFANPRAWEFRLDRADEENIAPQKIEVLAIDRFPNRAGGWHWRVALAVHFPGNLYEIAREQPVEDQELGVPVVLHVRPLPDASLRRGPYGRRAAKGGFALRWSVLPAFPADAHPIARG